MPGELVIVMLKYPEAGKVKTRLAASVGDAEAAAIYRRLVRATLAGIPVHQPLRVCFDPPERGVEVRDWLGPELGGRPPVEFCGQVGGDLGQRLEGAFAEAFADGYERVVAVGGDCVDVGETHYAEAWEMLRGGYDVVFGPSRDGGYYLVGLRGLEASLFEGIAWSGPETLRQSLAAAEGAALEVGILEALSDVDELADWEEVRDHIA